MNWQPIKTAPKDGTSVLIYVDEQHGIPLSRPYVIISFWRTHYVNGEVNARRAPEWEQKDMYAGFGGYEGPIHPKFWMPIPQFPKSV